MNDTLTLQYVLLAAIVVFAVYSIYRIIKNNFAPNKFKSKRSNCDRDCGCS